MISSLVTYFEKWSLLSHLLGNVMIYIAFISHSLLLVLVLGDIQLILLLLTLNLFIIVYLCFHLWSFVNWLILSLYHQEPITIVQILTFIYINSPCVSITCSSCQIFCQSCSSIIDIYLSHPFICFPFGYLINFFINVD
jgi:hypothetical protein